MSAPPSGLRRARTLWRLWRNERADPEPFYRLLADPAADALDRRHGPLAGQTIVDLGAGPGWYTEALRARGATVIPVDNDLAEMTIGRDAPPEGHLIADAGELPLEDASVDGAFCSNVLEHTPAAEPIIREIERILRPGGWAYISWTNWYSPGGAPPLPPPPPPRPGPRPPLVGAPARQAGEARVRGDAVGLPHRPDPAARPPAPAPADPGRPGAPPAPGARGAAGPP